MTRKVSLDTSMLPPVRFGQLMRHWRKQFQQAEIETGALDARLLLAAAANLDHGQLIAREHDEVAAPILQLMNQFGARRLTHEPVARILGHAEFYGRRFDLNADTLIPRPETEMLVDHAIEKLPQGGRFLDLGTGTGCIALSILAERPDCCGVMTDLSQGALDQALANAGRLGVGARVAAVRSDWFQALDEHAQFDLILSNPPYIARAEQDMMNQEALKFDPELALFAADDGMAAYEIILQGALSRLAAGGHVLFEIGFRQAEKIQNCALTHGFATVTIFKDLSGHNRIAHISH